MAICLDALTAIDRLYLGTHLRTPLLYKAGVRYQHENLGCEDWADVPTVIGNRWGDCEDLACWRAAELQLRGIPARAVQKPPKRIGPDLWLYHIVVRWPNGRIEDPSRILGMKGVG